MLRSTERGVEEPSWIAVVNPCVRNRTVGVLSGVWAVWVLPEDVRVRRAVGEGIGRSLRDTCQKSDVIPDRLRELLARLERANVLVKLAAVGRSKRSPRKLIRTV